MTGHVIAIRCGGLLITTSLNSYAVDEWREETYKETTIIRKWLDRYLKAPPLNDSHHILKFRRGLQEILFVDGRALTTEKLTSVSAP